MPGVRRHEPGSPRGSSTSHRWSNRARSRRSTLVQACLAQIDARPELNAFITRLDAPGSWPTPRPASARSVLGRYRGPLHGIPISVKDLDRRRRHQDDVGIGACLQIEATTDAPAIARLRAAGAIIIGKTNLHEFAFGTTSEESAFGPVRNPLDHSRSAGGSSGGAAAALATGMCFGALGTDTGGSIRIPSAACGTVGLKATVGEISCEGVVPLSTTLDHLGPMARSVADVALLFDGADRTDGRRTGDRARTRRSSSACRGLTSAIGSTPVSGRRSSGLRSPHRRGAHGPRPRDRACRVDAGRLSAHRAARGLALSRAAPRALRRSSTHPGFACGSRWGAISWPRTTSARCG